MFSPGVLFVASYIVGVLIGGALLKMSWATTDRGITWIDAFFTATSALCVTGLTVVDIGSVFSFSGQILIMILIQVGGLGIMTFAALLFLSSGWGVSMRQRIFLQETYSSGLISDIKTLVFFIFSFTFIAETAGALLLIPCWGQGMTLGQSIFYSVFHSIAAFCNAGFSLFPDNFIQYYSNPLLNLTITTLIILGGIGFPVASEVLSFLRGGKRTRMTLHTKLVLVTSAVLILFGTVIFWILERDYYLTGMSWWKQVLVSYFQSVTSRTAGFSTVDYGLLGNATLLLTIILMFIGASPGSTGGGIKTSAAAVIYVVMWNRLKGSEANNIFKATLSQEVVSRTITVIIVSIAFIFLILAMLMVDQQGDLPAAKSRGLFLVYLFETVSAFGTVGLSMGVTAKMSAFAKLLIILTMLVGRVGILTLVYIVVKRKAGPRYRYAEENVLIG